MDLGPPAKFLALAALAWIGWSQLVEDAGLRAQADDAACMGRACKAEFVKKRRQAFGYAFEYRTYGESSRVVTVRCSRPFWVFGSYRCDVEELDSANDVRFGQ